MNRDIINLEVAAGLWVGTPFCEKSAVRGAGASCHAAVLEVYFDAGWIERFNYPVSSLRGAGKVVDHFFAHDSHFMPVNLDERRTGDTLQFRLRSSAHFMLMLDDGKLFHCAENVGAVIAPNLPTPWAKRLNKVWRPK